MDTIFFIFIALLGIAAIFYAIKMHLSNSPSDNACSSCLSADEVSKIIAIENQKTINQVYQIINQLEVMQGSPIEIKEGPTSCQYTNEDTPKIINITIANGADCTNLYYWIEELFRKAKSQHAIEQSKFSHEKFNQLKQ